LLEALGAGGRPAAPARAKRERQPAKAAAPRRRTGEGKRAPRGLVTRFVEWALRARPGLTPTEILNLAATEEEWLIKLRSIRLELGSGRRQGEYESSAGSWSLAAPASAAVEEDGSPGPDKQPARDAAGASASDPSMPNAGSVESEAGADQDRGRIDLTW